MDKRHELVNDLGFSEKKASVYLTLVRFGEMSASQVAKRANLKRTTVYNILPELLNEGYIAKTKTSGNTVYFVNKVEDLERFFNEKKNRVTALVSELKKSVGSFDFQPKISIYEGVGGMKKYYQDIIDSVKPGENILTFINSDTLDFFVPEKLVKHYVDQRIKKRVQNLIISPPGEVFTTWNESASSELRQMKMVQFPYSDFSGDLKIYGNKISLISYKENFFALTIESKELSILHRSMFYIMWNAI